MRRRAPKQAVWRRHRVWPWALAATVLALLAFWQLARSLGLGLPPAASVLALRTTPRLEDGAAAIAAGAPSVEEGRVVGVDGGFTPRRLGASSLPTVAVLDGRGAPVPDCMVELHLPGQGREDTLSVGAEACGAVQLGEVRPGDYLLSAEAPGFLRSERPVHLTAGPSARTLVLADGVALSGHVVDASGRPVPGVSVVASPINAVARSDGMGAFRFSVPGPGVYSLEAHHSDLGGAVQGVTPPASGVVLRLQPRSVLELRVFSGGKPVEGVKAELSDGRDRGGAGEYEADRVTGADGAVRLVGFAPGSYTLGVLLPGALRPSRQTVVLRESATTAVTVTLPALASGSIAGEVLDATGKPVSGALVQVQPADVAPAQSDGEGQFRLRAVPGGVDYEVVAVVGQAKSAVHHSRAGDTGLRLSLSPARRYRGRVLDASHTPVRAFRVADVEVEADDGRFALALPASEGTVAFTIEAPQLAIANVLRPEGVEDVGDVVLQPAPVIHGLVREADGRPAAEALVVCEGCRGERDGERRLTAFSDAEGRFSLSVTVAHGERFRLLAMRDTQLGWAEAGRVGEAPLLTLAAAAPVRGRVLGSGGKAAPGVAVVFSEPLLEPLQLVTGMDGTFSGPVPPGLYQLRVVPDASKPPRTWTVQVPADYPLELATGAATR
jgi:Carboxypeptidase regulatory-like domain